MLHLHHLAREPLFTLLSMAIGCGAVRAQAAPAAPAGEVVRGADEVGVARDVVVLVGEATDDLESPSTDFAHALLQMPLDHLGMRLIARGLSEGPPHDLDPASVRALGTWFVGDEELPDWVWPWLERQSQELRVLHLGSLRPLTREDQGRRMRNWLARFGLGYDAREVADPSRVYTDFVREPLYPFESRPVYERVHLGPWNGAATNRVWLQTFEVGGRRRPRAPVVTGPWGGIGLQPWLVRVGGAADDRRWYAEPFEFCREALGLAGLPAPEPCVKNGRRMFLLHVDGDGFESVSSVVEGQLCGEVFRDRVVDRYRLPMTIGYVVASLTDRLEPDAPNDRMRLARELVDRPWVELASHAVLHPLNWRRTMQARSLPRSVVWYPSLQGYEHDMVAEVRESIRWLDRWIAPPGKRCRVMLWSGAANPDAATLAAAAAADCLNLNGGLSRWDALHDSVGFVRPWGKQTGEHFQVFAGAANENEFPGFFTTMPTAFRHIDTTIERTGSPRILKPANVYVHFYSAEHPARLAVLTELLDRWALREETIPVFASTYAGAVLDARERCSIARSGQGWVLRGFDRCRTVRFDGPTAPLDWQRCRNVLGAVRRGDALFVHLSAASARVAFAAGAVPWPHVEQANCDLTNVVVAPGELRITVDGFGSRLVVVAGLPKATAVRWSRDGEEAATSTDADGRLVLALGEGPATEVRVWAP